MSDRLSFATPPSVASAYWQALFDRRPARAPAGAAATCIEAETSGAKAQPSRLAAYREVCVLADDGRLPLTYPHILASGLHMAMLRHPDFPIRMIGLVHLANRIELIRPLPIDAHLAFDCRLESGRSKARGDEFSLVTEALWDGCLAWRETMSFLAPAQRKERRPRAESFDLPAVACSWPVAADTGRRYARVSGDWNPIHLAALLARPFGFPAAIAHGMWTVARCLGRLSNGSAGPGARLDVRFMKPLFLPNDVSLCVAAAEASGDQEFWLVSTDTQKPYLRGTWNPGGA